MCPRRRWRGECCPVSRPVKVRQKVSLHRHCYGEGPRHCQPHQLSKHTRQDAPDGNNTLQKRPWDEGTDDNVSYRNLSTSEMLHHDAASGRIFVLLADFCKHCSVDAIRSRRGRGGKEFGKETMSTKCWGYVIICLVQRVAPLLSEICAKKGKSHTEAFAAADSLHEMLSRDWVD